MSSSEAITIYANKREVDGQTLPRLNDLGAHLQVGELEIGDYVVSSSIVIERKSAQEFLESIISGRLFNQVGKMKLNFAQIIILIEGDVYTTRAAVAREAIDGALASLAALDGASVITVRSPVASADIIYRVAKHAFKESRETTFRRGKVAPGRAESLFCIEGVVGVGPTTAVKILEHFGSTLSFMNASIEDLILVPGIGNKKAERIYHSVRWQHSADEQQEQVQSMFSDG
mgnify:CR=1 FL=1|tara:strand:- start:20205 stop:20897 length:693 start_codon:yes stop_codon:yes gene_type:complete